MDIEFKISKNPVNYKKALQLLEKRVNHVKEGGRELVWFLEHPKTYTAGIRHKREEILELFYDFKNFTFDNKSKKKLGKNNQNIDKIIKNII